jgi:hypothetical protein
VCSRIRSILDSRGWFGTPRKTFRVFLDQKIQTHKDFLGFGCPKNSLNFGAQKTFEVFFGSEMQHPKGCGFIRNEISDCAQEHQFLT